MAFFEKDHHIQHSFDLRTVDFRHIFCWLDVHAQRSGFSDGNTSLMRLGVLKSQSGTKVQQQTKTTFPSLLIIGGWKYEMSVGNILVWSLE